MALEFVFILFYLTKMLGLLLEDSWELLPLKILTIARDFKLLRLGLPLRLFLLHLRRILATKNRRTFLLSSLSGGSTYHRHILLYCVDPAEHILSSLIPTDRALNSGVLCSGDEFGFWAV